MVTCTDGYDIELVYGLSSLKYYIAHSPCGFDHEFGICIDM